MIIDNESQKWLSVIMKCKFINNSSNLMHLNTKKIICPFKIMNTHEIKKRLPHEVE